MTVRRPSAFEANAVPERPADGGRCDNLAGLIVGHRHHSTAASAKQPVVNRGDRHRDGLLAPRRRPAAGKIRIHFAIPGGHTIFGFSSELNIGNQGPRSRIDDG